KNDMVRPSFGEQGPTVPTWGQLKHLTQQAEELIERGRHEATPMVMFVAMLAVLAFQPSGLAWRIPGMGQPNGLPSMGSQRVGHN
uniref:Uncharacterized protein n=1 Tax=Bos indicus x Bos taurus TaxID=30522 RepID=A0A4W2F6K7_BOBOX